MPGWLILSDLDRGAGPDRGARELDLSERNVNDLWRVATELVPDEPDRQVLIVTLCVRLGLGPAGLRIRSKRPKKEPTKGED